MICADATAAILLMRAADPDYRQHYGVLLEAAGDRIGRVGIFADTVEAEAYQFGNAILPQATRGIMPAFDPRLAFVRGYSWTRAGKMRSGRQGLPGHGRFPA